MKLEGKGREDCREEKGMNDGGTCEATRTLLKVT